ncbi:hypothetical protein PS2_032712 [Malus domestica]
MFYPYLFLCPSSSLQDKEKESNQPALGINLSTWNRLPGTPSLIAHLAVLSNTHLQHLMLSFRLPYLPGKQMMQVNMMFRSMWRQAQRIHVLIVCYFFKSKSISYHRGRKQRYLISCSSPILFSALALTFKTRRKKAISQNLKSNFRSGTDCLEALPGCLPSIALECSSSTADMSRIPSTNALGVWIC